MQRTCPTVQSYSPDGTLVSITRIAPGCSAEATRSTETCPACGAQAGQYGVLCAYYWISAKPESSSGWQPVRACASCGARWWDDAEFIHAPLVVEVTVVEGLVEIPPAPRGVRLSRGGKYYALDERGRKRLAAWLREVYARGARITAEARVCTDDYGANMAP